LEDDTAGDFDRVIGESFVIAAEQGDVGGGCCAVFPLSLHKYMVLAEKIVTALQRGVADTRWRDFGDIWSLARSRVVSGGDLQRAIREVALYRKAVLIALNDVLGGYADSAQPRCGRLATATEQRRAAVSVLRCARRSD
jgi:hypothetical protein